MFSDCIVRGIKKIGFTLPSSTFLARKMVSLVDMENSRHIVELGAGNGVITSEILRHIHPLAHLDIFEIDAHQAALLEEKYASYPNVTVYPLSAAHMDSVIALGSIDAVISTLPLGSISREGVESILAGISRILKDNGTYIQYQYWMANKKDVKRYFHIDRIHLEPRNFTPAWIYRTRKIDQ